MNRFDAIIIGTGIGGAAVGALLAHSGRKVLILDKNPIIGGRCTSYNHKGFILDLGVHLFALADKGSLGRVLQMTGAPHAIDWVTARRSTQQIGMEVRKYSQKNMISALPGDEQGNLLNLFTRVHTITDQEINNLWHTTVEQWLNEFTRHHLTHSFINSIVEEYFCVPAERASAAEFIKSFKAVLATRSSAYPKGGCIAIPRAYLSVVEKHGGEIRLNTGVKQIIVRNDTAIGVHLTDGSDCLAPIIISNADIKTTVNQLVGSDHFSREYLEKIANLTYASSAVMFKVGLKEKITDDQFRMYMPDDQSTLDSSNKREAADIIPEKVAGMIVVPTNFDEDISEDKNRQLICFGTCIPTLPDFDKTDWNRWRETLSNSFYGAFPEAKNKVLWEKMDTPQMVNAYAGEDGNIIGIGQTIDQIHELRPSVESPLKGMYYCSAEAGGHGIGTELAASSALELFEMLK